MEPRELQSAPKCAVSSVIASALPSGSHTGKQRALIVSHGLLYLGRDP